jgi:hypothetical protein
MHQKYSTHLGARNGGRLKALLENLKEQLGDGNIILK